MSQLSGYPVAVAAAVERHFTAVMVTRGLGYAHDGRLAGVSWDADRTTLAGLCRGSGSRVYRMQVEFEIGLAGLEVTRAFCNCPVQFDCKHCVAMILATAPQIEADLGAAASTSAWRRLADGLQRNRRQTARRQESYGIRFSRGRSPAVSDSLRAQLVVPNQQGLWVTTQITWSQLPYRIGPALHESPQGTALMRLAEVAGPAAPGSLTIDGESRAVWPALAECRRVGVELMCDRSLGGGAVELVDAFSLDHRVDPDGDGLTLRVSLSHDETPLPADQVMLLGYPRVYAAAVPTEAGLLLGPLPADATDAEADLLRDSAALAVPGDEAVDFLMEALPLLRQTRSITVSDEIDADLTVTGPEPVLQVTLNDNGARLAWAIRYAVGPRRRDLPLHDDGDPVRDWDAETQLWTDRIPLVQRIYKPIGVDRPALRPRDKQLTSAQAAVLCAEVLPPIIDAGELVVEFAGEDRDFRPAEETPQISFAPATDGDEPINDWLNLSATLTVGDQSVPITWVIAELASGASHMVLDDGTYFSLDTPELQRFAELLEEAHLIEEIEGPGGEHPADAALWSELLELGVVDEQLWSWQQKVRRLADARPPEPIPRPPGFTAELRPYQQDGLDWLSFLWDNELGGILADDMGLGKTVQTLALLTRAVADDPQRRFLVVAPTSVVTNWAAEAERFTPDLGVAPVFATERKSGASLHELVGDARLVITSYTLLRIDFEAYQGFRWAGAVFDEAQFLKNHNSKTHQCARLLGAGFKLAITGTPMENNLMELWSLLSVTAPGLYGRPDVFKERYAKPIESGRAPQLLEQLRRRVRPLMLRRTKDQVADDLPPKQDSVLPIPLGAKHRRIYDTHLSRERQKVMGLIEDWDRNRFQIFRSLTTLRQLSLHAGLIDDAHNAVASAKVDYLSEQIPELVAEGHSALIFSSFTGFLGRLREAFDAAGVSYSYLDGSVPAKARQAAIEAFTAGETQVFLISLKAGGFGLNLTAADYCFVCDPWWNPAAEQQAVDRAHRIGQQRPVTVYRLVSADTIEEKVVELQERKRELFAAVMDDGDMFGAAISADDVRGLLG